MMGFDEDDEDLRRAIEESQKIKWRKSINTILKTRLLYNLIEINQRKIDLFIPANM